LIITPGVSTEPVVSLQEDSCKCRGRRAHVLEHSTARASQLDHRSATALGDHVVELRALGPFAFA
jgi:hypothetical protein